MPTSIIKLKMY